MKHILVLCCVGLMACTPLPFSVSEPIDFYPPIPSESIPPGSWDHIVVVVEENRSAWEVETLPYLKSLETMGQRFLNSYGMYRPSQPNYVALFAGTSLGVADNLDHDLNASNIWSRLNASGQSMISYADGLPTNGYRGTKSGQYVRKHNPAASFPSVPDNAILPFTSFPTDFTALPKVAFILPDLDHDMHDGTELAGDTWLNTNLSPYVNWALTHNSLLIVTFDEPNVSGPLSERIFTVFVGQGITGGSTYSKIVNHTSLYNFILHSFGVTGF